MHVLPYEIISLFKYFYSGKEAQNIQRWGENRKRMKSIEIF